MLTVPVRRENLSGVPLVMAGLCKAGEKARQTGEAGARKTDRKAGQGSEISMD